MKFAAENTPKTAKDILMSEIRRRGTEWSQRTFDIEAARELPLDILEELRDIGAIGMGFPEKFGGLGLDSLDHLEVIEEISYYDTSIGWSCMIGMDSGLYSAFLDDAAIENLFRSKARTVTGGVVQPDGKALRVEGGYRLTGSYRLGSGVRHADVISAGAITYTGEQPDQSASGNYNWIIALVKPNDVLINDDWHSTGLAGSGSVQYSIDDVFVPEEHTFNFSIPKSRSGSMSSPDTLMRKMAGVPLGTIRRLLDEASSALRTIDGGSDGKSKPNQYRYQYTIGRCEAKYRAMWHAVHSSVGRKMRLAEGVAKYSELTPEDRIESVAVAQLAFRECLEISRELYDLFGSRSVYRGSRFDIGMRDLATMCQHVMAQDVILQSFGAATLGSQPGFPFALGDTL